MITTAFDLPGCRVVKTPGLVRGVTEVLAYGTAVQVERAS